MINFSLLLCSLTHAATGWMVWNSHCYYYSEEAVNKTLAQTACESQHNSYLVEVETIQEHNLLKIFMKSDRDYWAGVKKNSQNVYYWKNGGGIILSSIWEAGTPDQFDECARFRAGGNHTLNDRICSLNFNYICEKPSLQDVNYYCTNDQGQTTNLAIGRNTTQSSNWNDNTVSFLAVNNDPNPLCAVTNISSSAWWQVDLQDHFLIKYVVIHDANCCADQQWEFELRVYFLDPEAYFANYTVCAIIYDTTNNIVCSEGTVGRWLRIIKSSASASAIGTMLTLCEVEVYGSQCQQTFMNDTCETPVISYNVTLSDEQTTQSETTTSPEETTVHNRTSFTLTSNTNCLCPCSGYRNVSNQELMEELQEIIKELKVDAKTTSSYKRSLISADDKRPSAKVSGCLGLVLLIIVLLFFVTGDVINVIVFSYSLFKTRCKCTKK